MAIAKCLIMKSFLFIVPLFFVCLVGISADSAIQHDDDRVSNGAQAVVGEFPYVVSIGQAHLCGGFIYNKRFVVTVASCVYNQLPSKLKISAGGVSLLSIESTEQVVNVFAITAFPGFNYNTRLHDIAILEAAAPFTLNQYVNNSVLWGPASETPDTLAVIAGWGATQDGEVASTRLRKITVTLPADCSNYTTAEFDPNYMVCAGDVVASPCRFDEGSPLVENDSQKVVAIMSKNRGCNPDDTGYVTPSVYTKIQPYIPWIESIAGLQTDV